jgi:hypothetical protein
LGRIAQAQTYHRQATLGGLTGERGQCVVQVMVDGAAELAIRGDDITVTNLKGQAPELRQFQCTSPLPGNPAEFRFNPASGRGRQELVRPAAEGQPAVVRIEDPPNGAGMYAFELSWRAEHDDRDRMERRPRFTTDEAIEVCRKEVRRQLSERFRPDEIDFREIRLDDSPGRNEWIVGELEARRDERRGERMRFSCSVNFETGQVRSAQVDPLRDR